jgi:hypothetical protein
MPRHVLREVLARDILAVTFWPQQLTNHCNQDGACVTLALQSLDGVEGKNANLIPSWFGAPISKGKGAGRSSLAD